MCHKSKEEEVDYYDSLIGSGFLRGGWGGVIPFMNRYLLCHGGVLLGFDIFESDLRMVISFFPDGPLPVLYSFLWAKMKTGKALLTVMLPLGYVAH